MKCNKKKNKNKDTVTRQDMIIVCLYIELFYLLGYYLGQYFFRRLGPLWNILKGIWDNSFSGILFIFQWIPAPGCFSFVLFLGLKAKKLFWASVFWKCGETLELLLILSTRSTFSALVFQRPASNQGIFL